MGKWSHWETWKQQVVVYLVWHKISEYATESLAHVLGTRVTQINIYNAAIDKANLSIYKYIHKYKSSKKSVINDHLHKVNYIITRIQDTSSKWIENSIHKNSRSRSVSNIYEAPEKSYFSTNYIMSANSKPMNKRQHS